MSLVLFGMLAFTVVITVSIVLWWINKIDKNN